MVWKFVLLKIITMLMLMLIILIRSDPPVSVIQILVCLLKMLIRIILIRSDPLPFEPHDQWRTWPGQCCGSGTDGSAWGARVACTGSSESTRQFAGSDSSTATSMGLQTRSSWSCLLNCCCRFESWSRSNRWSLANHRIHHCRPFRVEFCLCRICPTSPGPWRSGCLSWRK